MTSPALRVALRIIAEEREIMFYAWPRSAREILSLCSPPAPLPNRFSPSVMADELPTFTHQTRAELWLTTTDGRAWCFHSSGDALGGVLDPPRIIFEHLIVYLTEDGTAVDGYTCKFAPDPRGHALRRVTSVFHATQCLEQRKRKHTDAQDVLDAARVSKRPRRMADEQEAALLVLTAPPTAEEDTARATLDLWMPNTL
jgi:hypothetical protein